MSDLNVAAIAARQLEAVAKATPPLRSVRAEAPPVKVEGATATIRLYQSIDNWGEFWGMSATEFAAELDALPATVETIDLRINSGGGMVFEAVTILNILRSHPAKVVATVEGLAASAASFIAASADETIMMPGSQMMIHAVRGVAIGTATDLRQVADLFDHLTLVAAEIYATKSGKPESDWLDLMTGTDDHWYSAAEAVEAGLADRIGQNEEETEGESASELDEEEEPSERFDPALSLALLNI